jgi:hypothetical protein
LGSLEKLGRNIGSNVSKLQESGRHVSTKNLKVLGQLIISLITAAFFGFHHQFNLVQKTILASSGSSILPIAVMRIEL